MVDIRQYKPDHFDLIMKEHSNAEEISSICDKQLLSREGAGITVWHNEQIFACMGIIPLWQGTGEAWMLVTALALSHPKVLLKTVREWLRRAFYSMELIRVQADVDTTVPKLENFLQHIPMKWEGNFEAYYQGHTYARYAMTRRDLCRQM